MAEFPSPLERTVASALLLLSISPSPPSTYDRSLKMNGCLRKILKENAPERYRRFVIIPTLPLPYSLHQMHPPILHRWNACCSLLILVATS
ncbi:hypothetical protein IC582_019261 [Cucumis melo]